MTSERFRKQAIKALQQQNPGLTYQQAAEQYEKAASAAADMLRDGVTIDPAGIGRGGKDRQTGGLQTVVLLPDASTEPVKTGLLVDRQGWKIEIDPYRVRVRHATSGVGPDAMFADRALAEAGWNRLREWDEDDQFPYRPLRDGMSVLLQRASSVPAARAFLEAHWQPNHVDAPCRCSGTCLHGEPCDHVQPDGTPCPRRYVHTDRFPDPAVVDVDVSKWRDEYHCDPGGDPAAEVDRDNTHRMEAEVWLPDLPWGTAEQGLLAGIPSIGIGPFDGVRHPQMQTPMDLAGAGYDDYEDDDYEGGEGEEYEFYDPASGSPFDMMAAAGNLMGIAMQMPQVVVDLSQALKQNDNDVVKTTANKGLLRTWAKAAPEVRSGIMLNWAWFARKFELPEIEAGHPHAYLYAKDLHEYAVAFTDGSEKFHGVSFPAMPLPGQAGALASNIGFDRDDVEISLEVALRLMAIVPRDYQDEEEQVA